MSRYNLEFQANLPAVITRPLIGCVAFECNRHHETAALSIPGKTSFDLRLGETIPFILWLGVTQFLGPLGASGLDSFIESNEIALDQSASVAVAVRPCAGEGCTQYRTSAQPEKLFKADRMWNAQDFANVLSTKTCSSGWGGLGTAPLQNPKVASWMACLSRKTDSEFRTRLYGLLLCVYIAFCLGLGIALFIAVFLLTQPPNDTPELLLSAKEDTSL